MTATVRDPKVATEMLLEAAKLEVNRNGSSGIYQPDGGTYVNNTIELKTRAGEAKIKIDDFPPFAIQTVFGGRPVKMTVGYHSIEVSIPSLIAGQSDRRLRAAFDHHSRVRIEVSDAGILCFDPVTNENVGR